MKEEQIILKGLQQGSEQAYKDLFTAYFSDLVLYANHFIKNTTEDAEGLQTMRMLGRNMAWLLKGVKREERPEPELRVMTNFIR